MNPTSSATQSDDACPSAVFFLSVRPILPYAKALSTPNNTHIAAIPGATAQRKNRQKRGGSTDQIARVEPLDITARNHAEIARADPTYRPKSLVP